MFLFVKLFFIKIIVNLTIIMIVIKVFIIILNSKVDFSLLPYGVIFEGMKGWAIDD